LYSDIREEEREAICNELFQKKETVMLAQYIKQIGYTEGVLEAIELGLTIKFGSDGLKHMSVVSRIKDVEKLRAIKDAIKTAANLSDIESVITKRRGKKTA
jgi:hypothetical protein